MSSLKSIAVVHLLREVNGPAPFERFLDSYVRHPAGRAHDLVLLFKGYAPEAASRHDVLRRAAGTGATVRSVDVSDAGYDLTAYAAAAHELPHERLCFLNSFSEILAAEWLAKLDAALDAPAAGIAGATGSWESTLSLAARMAGVRNAYATAFPDRRALIHSLHDISGTQPGPALIELLFVMKMTLLNSWEFPPFPAVHLRTNGFLVDREVFLSLRMGDLTGKRDAYRFESGRRGMTAQLARRGLDPVLVDRHGVLRRPPEWDQGDLFRQGHQADLLIADNQTRVYDAASPAHRAVLSRQAWGPQARPA